MFAYLEVYEGDDFLEEVEVSVDDGKPYDIAKQLFSTYKKLASFYMNRDNAFVFVTVDDKDRTFSEKVLQKLENLDIKELEESLISS